MIDDGSSRAALVTVDAGAIPNELWNSLSARAERELRIPRVQLLLTATHTHSAPWTPVEGYEGKIFEAMRQAAAALKPARMASGTGVSYINVNRNIIDPQTQRWWEGPNYDGASDKTVAVVRFETPAGEPIAVYYNYGVHAVITGTLDPGERGRARRGIHLYRRVARERRGRGLFERRRRHQNPIFFNQTYELRDIRIKDYAQRGEDISNAMPPGGTGLDRTNLRVALLMEQQKRMILSMGQMLGEEVLHVTRAGLERPVGEARIDGASKTVSCPGRKRLDQGRAGFPGSYEDGDPVDIRSSLLMIGDTADRRRQRRGLHLHRPALQAESPYKHTMMSTLYPTAWPRAATSPTMLRSATTRSRSCPRGSSLAARKPRSWRDWSI